MSGVAFNKALDGHLQRRSNASEMLHVDLDPVFDAGNFDDGQAACFGHVFEAVASRQAALPNAISNVQDVDNVTLGLIEMIERYVHTWSLRITPDETAGPQYSVICPFLDA
jgi:hypothetical protein